LRVNALPIFAVNMRESAEFYVKRTEFYGVKEKKIGRQEKELWKNNCTKNRKQVQTNVNQQ